MSCIVVVWGLFSAIISCIHKSIHLPEMEIHLLKTACGCPCGGIDNNNDDDKHYYYYCYHYYYCCCCCYYYYHFLKVTHAVLSAYGMR